MEIDDGLDQRRASVGIALVHVGLGRHQRLPGFEVAFTRREQQCGEPASGEVHGHAAGLGLELREVEQAGARVDVGSVLDQELNHRGMLFRGREHQRGLPAPALRPVHLRAVVEQRLDRGGIACARGDHQRRLAFGLRGIGIGPGFEKRVDHGGVAVHAGFEQAERLRSDWRPQRSHRR